MRERGNESILGPIRQPQFRVGGKKVLGAADDLRFHMGSSIIEQLHRLLSFGLTLFGQDKGSYIFDAMNNEDELSGRAEHGRIHWTPVTFLPTAAFVRGQLNRIALHRHGISAEIGFHTLERGAQIAHTIGRWIAGNIRKNFKEFATDNAAIPRRRAQVSIAYGDNLVVFGSENEIGAGRGFEQSAEMNAQRLGAFARANVAVHFQNEIPIHPAAARNRDLSAVSANVNEFTFPKACFTKNSSDLWRLNQFGL